MNFADAACRLAGQTALALGWRPAEFWNATPDELGTILAALGGPGNDAADQLLLSQLMEQFPDG